MSDLIERQVVMDTVAKSALDLNDPDENWIMQDRIKEIPSVQPDLQPTCNQLATDCISRQAAIEAVEKYNFSFPEYMERFVTELRDAMKEDLKEVIARLPSAEPERKTGRWIQDESGDYKRSECGGREDRFIYGTENLCDSCITKGCIFQSGIVRSHCDFYNAKRGKNG